MKTTHLPAPSFISRKTDIPFFPTKEQGFFSRQKSNGLFGQNTSFFGSVQRKPTLGPTDDSYEKEADSVADKVMRMPAPEEEVQRKCTDCEEKEKLQRQPVGSTTPMLIQRTTGASGNEGGTPVTDSVAAGIATSRGGGHALDDNTRGFMENRIGHDFSGVRIHTGANAVQLSRELNAQAFTTGNDIYFNEGSYNPGSHEGRHLLAHELTHTVQQGTNARVQRRILIGGTPMTVDQAYLDTVKKSFGDSAVTIVEKMHNNGNPPDYSFTDWDKFSTELRIRTNAIKGMDLVHNNCCAYPTTQPNGYLNPAYWQNNGFMDFTLKTLPSGKQPSDAVEAIFAPNAGTQLECLTMTIAIEYYSLLKGMGKDKFNKKFAGGAGLLISTKSTSRGGDIVDNEYKNLSLSKKELVPGDWVYFKNFKNYPVKYPNGLWRGENAIVMGDDQFRGFGVSTMSEDDMNKELVKAYNISLPLSNQKTVADLLAEGGGLQKSPVYRPDTNKTAK